MLFYCMAAALGVYFAANNLLFHRRVYSILRRNHSNSKLIENSSKQFTAVFLFAIFQVACYEILTSELFGLEFFNFEFSDEVLALLRVAPVNMLLYTGVKLGIQIFQTVLLYRSSSVSSVNYVALVLSSVTLIQNMLTLYFKLSAAGQRTEMEKRVYQKLNEQLAAPSLSAAEIMTAHVLTVLEGEATEQLNALWHRNSIIRDRARVNSNVILLRKEVLLFYDRVESSRAERVASLRSKLWNIALTKVESALARVDMFQLAADISDFACSSDTIAQQRALIASFKGTAQQLYELTEKQHQERLLQIQFECDLRQPTQLAEKVLKHIKAMSNENIRLWSKACAASVNIMGHDSVRTLSDISEQQLVIQLKYLLSEKAKKWRHQRSLLLKQELKKLFELQDSVLLNFVQSLSAENRIPRASLDAEAWALLSSESTSSCNSLLESFTASAQLSSFSVFEKEFAHFLDCKSLAPLSTNFFEKVMLWRQVFIKSELNDLTVLLSKEKDFILESDLKLHKQFHQIVIHSPSSRNFCCNSKIAPVKSALVAKDAETSVCTTVTHDVILDVPELSRDKQVAVAKQRLVDADSELQRQQMNFRTQATHEALEASKLLFEKLKEHSALSLFDKLQEKSITLALDINDLVTNLALNFGESKKLRKVVSAISLKKPTEAKVTKTKRHSNYADEAAQPPISDDDSYSSSSSYAIGLDPEETARNLLAAMKPKLGASIDPRPQEVTGGVRVNAVVSPSAASLGDLRCNDIVLEVNGAPVNTPKE